MTQENTMLAAVNAVLSNFTQQIVEQSTSPLINRIATLERQQEELYDIIKVSLNTYVNNAVKHAIESPEHLIWVSILTNRLLDEVDNKTCKALKSISASDIRGITQLVDEHLQNQPPLDADDIDGLEKFVRDMIDDLSDGGSDNEEVVRGHVRDALRTAADSM